MKPAILLDFDGVVLRKHVAQQVVANRCMRYVQHRLNIRNPLKAQKMNEYLYKTYGHSCSGLNHIGAMTDLKDFNTYVYGNLDYQDLFHDVQTTNKQDIENLRSFLGKAKPVGNIYLLSNAPVEWCQNILYYMGFKEGELDLSLSYITESHLKPAKETFDSVKRELGSVHTNFVFLDDCFINFERIMNDGEWTKIMVCNEPQETPLLIKKDLMVVNDLKQASLVMERISVPGVKADVPLSTAASG